MEAGTGREKDNSRMCPVCSAPFFWPMGSPLTQCQLCQTVLVRSEKEEPSHFPSGTQVHQQLSASEREAARLRSSSRKLQGELNAIRKSDYKRRPLRRRIMRVLLFTAVILMLSTIIISFSSVSLDAFVWQLAIVSVIALLLWFLSTALNRSIAHEDQQKQQLVANLQDQEQELNFIYQKVQQLVKEQQSPGDNGTWEN